MTFNEWLYSQQPMQYQSSGSVSGGGYGGGTGGADGLNYHQMFPDQHVGMTTSPSLPGATDTPPDWYAPAPDAYGGAQTLPQQGSIYPPPPPINYIPGSTYKPLGHYA
jgi:hypothetical protein